MISILTLAEKNASNCRY